MQSISENIRHISILSFAIIGVIASIILCFVAPTTVFLTLMSFLISTDNVMTSLFQNIIAFFIGFIFFIIGTIFITLHLKCLKLREVLGEFVGEDIPHSSDFNIKKPAHVYAFIILLSALFLIIILPILSILGLQPTVTEMTGATEITETIILMSSIITIIIFIGTSFLWYLLVNRYSIKKILFHLKLRIYGIDMAILWGVIAAIVMFAIVFVIGATLYMLGFDQESLTNVEDVMGGLSIASMLFIVIFQSTTEEILFRGFLLDKISSVAGDKINPMAGKVIAIALTSFLFGLAHLSYGKIYPAIMPVVMGLILGVLVIKTKNLYSAIVAHMLFNLTSITLYVLDESLNLGALIL